MASTLSSPRDSSFFLCKYFVGRRLSHLRPEWAFLSDNSAPSAFSPFSLYDSCLSILSEIADTELSSKNGIFEAAVAVEFGWAHFITSLGSSCQPRISTE